MSFTFRDKVDFSPIMQGEAGYADAQVGRITYDADNHRLYAAVGCKGLLWLDIEGSHSWHPVSMGCHTFTGDLAGATVIQVVPGPGNYVLAALLENGVAILDASSPTTFVENPPVAVHRLRFQATALWPTDDPGGWTYWVADGRGGVHKIEFPAP